MGNIDNHFYHSTLQALHVHIVCWTSLFIEVLKFNVKNAKSCCCLKKEQAVKNQTFCYIWIEGGGRSPIQNPFACSRSGPRSLTQRSLLLSCIKSSHVNSIGCEILYWNMLMSSRSRGVNPARRAEAGGFSSLSHYHHSLDAPISFCL